MILRLLIPAAALALLGAAPPMPPMSAEETVAANTVRSHVEFLADDRLEGRDTGSRGHEIAATYVASQFRALGLEPGGADGSWFQQVPLRRATHAQPPAVTLTIGGKSQPLRHGVNVALRPSLTEQHRSIQAGMVFVGYGLDEPTLGFNDYRRLDVRGKIVVALRDTPVGVPSEIAAHLRSTKDDVAAAHGAIGFIEVPRDPARPGRTRDVAATARRPVIDWLDSTGRTGNVPVGLRASLTLSPDVQERLFQGAARSLAQARQQARGTLRPAGFPLAARISITADSAWQDFKSPEVIGRIPGADRRRASEYVVLMAHLDHLGIKPDAKPGEDAIYNGALDNAAGVATMLEAAREFVASGQRPARSVLFIANTGEERGLLGADYLAAHPTVPIGSITSVVDLDMPLPLYDFKDVIAFGADHSTVARTVAEAGATMGVAVAPDPMPEESIFTRSDHYRFVLRGVPAILLMTGYANGGEAVWKRFLASVYHSPQDDLSQPIEWRALARYGMLNYRISRALADAPDRPRWIANDYFGDRFASGQPRSPARSP